MKQYICDKCGATIDEDSIKHLYINLERAFGEEEDQIVQATVDLCGTCRDEALTLYSKEEYVCE